MVRSPGMVILFDIDGTLIDHDTAETIAVAALGGRMEHTDAAAGFLQRWRSAFERHYNRYLAAELSIQQQRRERFREIFDPNLSDAAADHLSALYIDEYLAACDLYSDVKLALARSSRPFGVELRSSATSCLPNGNRLERRTQPAAIQVLENRHRPLFWPLDSLRRMRDGQACTGHLRAGVRFNGRIPIAGRLCWRPA